MKYFLTLSVLLLFVFIVDAKESVQWLNSYDQALAQAKKESKPILLYFTGSDWCGWCQKLDKEALETPDFVHLTANQFVFVRLNYPSKIDLPESEIEQNKTLQKQFNVRGFPTVILLNSKGKQIGITGYRPGDGTQYAKHLQQIVDDYTGYKEQILSMEKLSGNELKKLYDSAKVYRTKEDVHAIIENGIKSDQSNYFFLEKMRNLANEQGFDTKEALDLKEKILKNDPNNTNYTHYELAVIEFDSRYKEMKENKRSLQSTITPLLGYIDRFGQQDKENIWRLKMIISQVLYDQYQFKQALKYAEDSFKNAPQTYQTDIAEVIDDINMQMEYYR